MQIQEKTGEKVFYLTVLNVLSAWCVVMLHCNGIFWTRPEGRLWGRKIVDNVKLY